MAKLTVTTDGLQGEHVLSESNTIGRHPDNDISLLHPLISGHHATLELLNGEWLLRDLQSSNGTFVNATRVERTILREGDQFTVGPAVIVLSETAAVPGELKVSIEGPDDGALQIHGRVDGRDSEQFAPVDQIQDLELLKRDYEKLRIANELNRAIGLEPDIDVLLARILNETFKLLPADRGVILLMDPQTHKLTPRAIKHRKESNEQIVLSKTVINEVFGTGAAVLTSDAMMDSRFSGAQSIIAMGMRSTMCVPMIYRSQLLGIVHLDSLYARGAFSTKDLQILTGLAAQAGRAIDNAYKAQEIERNALARRDFERLLPPEIVEQIVSGKVELKRGGELRETAVLFSDIRGFTKWSEQHEPAHIVSILNDYFELMVDAIHRNHGTLDKFMGDGIMALFGAPITHDNDSLNAVNCALDMMDGLAQLNARLKSFNQSEVSIGIGINTGPVIAGYMGSSKSMEYTTIGDHVNLAARLCGAATTGQILLSQNTMDAVAGSFNVETHLPIKVKGKRDPVAIYEVVGRSEHNEDEQTHPGLDL